MQCLDAWKQAMVDRPDSHRQEADKTDFTGAIAQRLRAAKMKLGLVDGAGSVIEALQATWIDTSSTAKDPMEDARILAQVYDDVRKLASKDENAKRSRIDIAEALVLCCAKKVYYGDRSIMLEAFTTAFDKEVDETVMSQLLQAYFRSMSELPAAFPSRGQMRSRKRSPRKKPTDTNGRAANSQSCHTWSSSDTRTTTPRTQASWCIAW